MLTWVEGESREGYISVGALSGFIQHYRPGRDRRLHKSSTHPTESIHSSLIQHTESCVIISHTQYTHIDTHKQDTHLVISSMKTYRVVSEPGGNKLPSLPLIILACCTKESVLGEWWGQEPFHTDGKALFPSHLWYVLRWTRSSTPVNTVENEEGSCRGKRCIEKNSLRRLTVLLNMESKKRIISLILSNTVSLYPKISLLAGNTGNRPSFFHRLFFWTDYKGE